MSTTRALGLVLAAALSASALAGCSQGGDDKKEAPTAKDAISKSQDTVKKYARLSLKMKSKAKDEPGDMQIYGDAHGTVQEAKGEIDGSSVEMTVIGDKQYIKGGKEFWEATSPKMPSSVLNKVAGTWLEMPLEASDKSNMVVPAFIKGYTDKSNASVKSLLDTHEKVTEEKVGTRDAWKVVSSDKKTIAWVSADGKYDILKCQGLQLGDSSSSDSDKEPIDFFDQGKTHEVKAPQGARKAEDILQDGM